MRRYFHIILTLALGMFGISCSRTSQPLKDVSIRHASLLHMETLSHDRTLCRITNPWAPQQTAIQYLLVNACDSTFSQSDLQQITGQYGDLQVLRTPLQRQALTASCHAWLLAQLESADKVAVICDAGYVIDSVMRQRISHGDVLDGGSSMSPNSEILVAAGCDAIWISPFENSSFRFHNDRYQIPEIYCADYMETSPLGRAEWVRFYGRLVGRAEMADSLFAIVEARYDSIACHTDTLLAQGKQPAPTLLCEMPYVGTWYVPGGRSTLGLMYQDAGFQYPWASDTHAGSLALAPEMVFSKAQAADVWIFKYNNEASDITLQQLISQHPFFREIQASRNGRVYGCNTATCNYFDITPFRPDLLLEELCNIAQNNNATLRFFKLLQANTEQQ